MKKKIVVLLTVSLLMGLSACGDNTSEEKNPDISITTEKNALLYLVGGKYDELADVAKIEGNTELLTLIMDNLNAFDTSSVSSFNIVEP